MAESESDGSNPLDHIHIRLGGLETFQDEHHAQLSDITKRMSQMDEASVGFQVRLHHLEQQQSSNTRLLLSLAVGALLVFAFRKN